jgi:hypothetical protein
MCVRPAARDSEMRATVNIVMNVCARLSTLPLILGPEDG